MHRQTTCAGWRTAARWPSAPEPTRSEKSEKRGRLATHTATAHQHRGQWCGKKNDDDSSPLQPFLLPLFLLSSTRVSLHNFPLSLNACQVSQSLPCFSVPLCRSAHLSPSSLRVRIRSSSAIQTGNYISVLCWSWVLFSINGWTYYIRDSLWEL